METYIFYRENLFRFSIYIRPPKDNGTLIRAWVPLAVRNGLHAGDVIKKNPKPKNSLDFF